MGCADNGGPEIGGPEKALKMEDWKKEE